MVQCAHPRVRKTKPHKEEHTAGGEELATKTARGRASSRTSERRQFTITVAADLGDYLEQRSAITGMNKSAVVSRAIEAEKEREEEELMREGYEEMATHDLKMLKEFEHVDREGNDSWPEY